MSEIKHVIGLLCKQLNLLLDTKLKPEHFRLAKFNKSEQNVVEVLEKAMKVLIQKSNHSDDDVKKYLKSLNYPAHLIEAYDETNKQSREVLLIVSFIVSQNLGPVLIKNELLSSPFHDDFILNKSDKDSPIKIVPTFKNQNDSTNYTEWIRGRNEQHRKMSLEYGAQIEKLLAKLNINNKDYTINELMAMNSKKHCTEFLAKTERVNEILDNYQLWLKKEDLFWQWMATVVAERDKESAIN